MNELSKGFTGIEINGVRFSNIGEMLRYMDKQREQLINAKEIIREFVEWATWQGSNCPNFKSIQDKAEAFLNSEVEK